MAASSPTFREPPGAVEITAIGRNERDDARSHRRFSVIDRVLEGDLPSTVGPLGRQIPMPGAELDQGQIPQESRAQPLVAFAPLPVEAFEQRACPIEETREDEYVPQGHSRVEQLAAVGDGRGQFVGLLSESKSIRFAGVGAKGGNRRHGPGAQRVVVDLLGQFERGACVALRSPEPSAK